MRNKHLNTTQILKILKIFQSFEQKKLDALTKDFQRLFGKRLKKKLLKNYFFLLSFWQSLYIKNQKRLSDLKFLWKQNWRKYIENKNHFLNLVTLVEANTLSPIDADDQIADIEPPVFEEETGHNYSPLKAGEVPEQYLDPPTNKLKTVPAKVIGALHGIINRLSNEYFAKTEKEMLNFRQFPEELPKVISKGKDRPNPKRFNVLAFIGLKWEIVLYLAYACAVSAELMVFYNTGVFTLHLQPWKAWMFSVLITGISYLLGLYFFRFVLNFLRSKGYIPTLYKLFLGLMVIYVLASGFLSFNAQQEQRQENQLVIETQTLNNLQLQYFANPTDTALEAEITKQQQRVDDLSKKVSTPSQIKTTVSAIFFMLMGFMSLATSGFLLAVILCVGKASFLKRSMKRAEKALISVEAEYEWRISLFKKARELMAIYIFQLGRFQAIESLLVTPPSFAELTPAKSPAPNEPHQEKPEPDLSDMTVNEPAEILSEETYGAMYNN